MRLTELEPEFLRIDDFNDPVHHQVQGDRMEGAHGLLFVCPLCSLAIGSNNGAHRIICWRPMVPQTFHPVPGRWDCQGSGLHDISLVAGSSSIFLQGPGGCQWHGFIRNGNVEGGLEAGDIARARDFIDQCRRRAREWRAQRDMEATGEAVYKPADTPQPRARRSPMPRVVDAAPAHFQPSPHLAFKGGKLHQKHLNPYNDDQPDHVWAPVPELPEDVPPEGPPAV